MNGASAREDVGSTEAVPRRRPGVFWLAVLAAAIGFTAAPLVAEWFAVPGAGDNVLVRAEIETTSTISPVARILRGPLPEESGPRSLQPMVRVAPGIGEITFRFPEPTRIAALVAQAAPDDSYRVEARSRSTDEWKVVWNVASTWQSATESPATTRIVDFDPPLEVSELRFSNDAPYGTRSELSALRAFEAVPEDWPDISALRSPSLRARYPLTVDYRKVNLGRFALAFIATILLVVCSPAMLRRVPPRTASGLRALAITASLLAGTGWWNIMQLTAEGGKLLFESYWDVHHYYLSSKYAPELGHTLLYTCYLAAESEDGLGIHQLRRPMVRDLTTREARPTAEVMSGAPELCKSRFSPERWEEWLHDHRFFRTHMRHFYWNGLAMDYGFNASPAWLVVGRSLATWAPLGDGVFAALISIDTLFFVSMFAMAWLSFGWRATCAAIVFFGTNQLAGSYEMLGAFLRNDWLFLSVAGICLLKQERPFLAGAALAYATLLRVFPALIVLGVLLKIGRDMAAARSFRVAPFQRSFILGGLIGTIVVGGLSVVAGGRASAWPEFVVNLVHHSDLQVEVAGLPAFLREATGVVPQERNWAGDGEVRLEPRLARGGWQPGEARWVAIRLASLALFLALFMLAVGREREWVAAVLALGLIPLAGDVAHYYYVILLAYAFLGVRSEAIGRTFSVMTVLFAGLGLGFLIQIGERENSRIYAFAAAVVILFALWANARLAFAPRVSVDGSQRRSLPAAGPR
jgi:hypothetical protein